MSRMIGTIAVFALTACSRSPDAALTVPYYRANAAERESMLRVCADDPGKLRTSAPCVNAREAARTEDVGSLRRLPPMGLPGAGNPDKAPESPPTE